MTRPLILPVLPVKNTVILPGLDARLTVGRTESVAAVEAALAREDKFLIVVAQKSATVETPTLQDLYDVGTIAIAQVADRSLPILQVVVHGIDRVRLLNIEQEQPYLTVRAEYLSAPHDSGNEVEAMQREIVEQAGKIYELSGAPGPANIGDILDQIKEPIVQAYLVASFIGLTVDKLQNLLQAPSRLETLRILHEYLTHELHVRALHHKISNDAATEITKEQREYLLRHQMKAIQDELGEQSPEQAGADEIKRRLSEADLPDDVRKEASKLLARIERMSAHAPDYQIESTHLELIVELPWKKLTEDNLDLRRARTILDEDHFDLKDVKARIVEHLAVMKMNPKAKAPILCFVGPPGVGKTSLGQSIARALGRKFERQSLGGLHDEAELRGHRRTYIGAMPGRILEAIRRAGVRNPLLMLDEVDKLGRDFRGDPAAALMEILDPAQNSTFHDNYLDLPFDLSKVFFITTANTLDSIPAPLLDRMEVLRLAGYSDDEKLEIARRYLVPRQVHEAGFTDEQLKIADDALLLAIRRYTREAGVRELERMIASLARKIAAKFADGQTSPVNVTADSERELLGPERFFQEEARKELPPGVAAGLAWTEAGGEVLYVEAVLLTGAKDVMITGQLGSVMQESARAARSYAWSHAANLGIDKKLMQSGIHIHVPAGATPKDGPSAGVTMVTALVSLFTDRPARNDTAMTGEITLSGIVLPVGGIKEKILAAHRASLKRVILPKANMKDLEELPDPVRASIEFTPVERIEEVIEAALTPTD